MAEYNGNSIFLSINAVSVGALWRGMEMKLGIDKEDASAGASTEWKKSNSKLKEATAKVTLVYDTISAPTDIGNVYNVAADHKSAIIYGPEGNGSGKLKDDRDWLVTGISGPSTSVDKKLVVWEIDLVSTGEPRSNIYDGDTFS